MPDDESAQHLYLLGFTGGIPFKGDMLGELLECLPVIPLFLRLCHGKKYIERALIVVLRVSRNKTQDMLPGVCRNIGKLDGAPVKETMGSTRIDNHLMFNASLIQHLVKALYGADRNIRIGPTKQAKHRITDLVSLLQ